VLRANAADAAKQRQSEGRAYKWSGAERPKQLDSAACQRS